MLPTDPPLPEPAIPTASPSPTVGFLRWLVGLVLWGVVLTLGVLAGWDAFDLLALLWVDAAAHVLIATGSIVIGPDRGCARGCIGVVMLPFFGWIPLVIATFVIPLVVARPDAFVGTDSASITDEDFGAVFDRIDLVVVIGAVALLGVIATSEVWRRRSTGPAWLGGDPLAAAVGRATGLVMAVAFLAENPDRTLYSLVAAVVFGRLGALCYELLVSASLVSGLDGGGAAFPPPSDWRSR